MAPGNTTQEGCHFIDGLLAVPIEQLGAAMEATGANQSDRVFELLEGVDNAEAVAATIGLLDVDDPHVTAEELAGFEIPASPVHAVGFQGHTKAMSGTQPETAQISFPDVPRGGENNIVAVVDSGIAAELPPWMSVIHDPMDIEAPDNSYAVPTSHGTFVASLLRQISPNHVVSLAAARPDRGQLSPPPEDDGNPTNELEIAAAILRLIDRHRENPERVQALNISLGAYACHPESTAPDSYLLAMRVALDAWRQVFPSVPIFAAGGNSTSPEPVYPGAWRDLEDIHAVAASDQQREVVWDDSDVETAPPNPRFWITDGAVGSDVLGLSGQDASHTVKWSGSSFATAVATASWLKGENPTIADGIVWWPENVDGLYRV